MEYSKGPDAFWTMERLLRSGELADEYGARGVQDVLDEVGRAVDAAVLRIRALPVDEEMRSREPDDFSAIRALRPAGPRRMSEGLPTGFPDRLAGALFARMAGCTLGAPVEGWSIADMTRWATCLGDAFPPVDYWTGITGIPDTPRYFKSTLADFTRGKMHGVPVDDDTAYTLLGLLVAEEYGPGFTTEDVGRAWVRYLPVACTAEGAALSALKDKVPALSAADRENPYVQWIGADIRSDPWAWLAPAWPEKAAELAYRDAILSHRRNGVYGAMFFAAAQSAAFAVDDPLEAVRIGLSEIPASCALAEAVRWALDDDEGARGYQEARRAVDARFPGMHPVHTLNNACLTIFGLRIGGTDVTRVLSETVAMGLDNDCTAATAGSIVGAVVGGRRIPGHWTKPFDGYVRSYLNGTDTFGIEEILARFTTQALRFRQAQIMSVIRQERTDGNPLKT
jgi:ADP-ribosylglycohydrolase